MLISIFNSGSSNGQSPVNYLLNNKDHTGKIRSVLPELVDGDPQTTIDLINNIDRKYKYTSGVIAFRAEENPTEKEQKEIINAFRKSFLPGLDKQDNFNDLWVAHLDKGRLELHFIVVAEELKSGKRLNVSPPGKRNQDHFNTFVKVTNQFYGWNQVNPDPLKIALTAFDLKVHDKEAKTSKVIKNYLSEKLHRNILDGKVQDRAQLIDYLKQHKIEITRVGKDYLSIKMPNDQRARRLKGPMFEEGANYDDLIKQHYASKIPTKLTDVEYKEVKDKLQGFIADRTAFNTKLYLTPKKSFRRPRKAKQPTNSVKSLKENIKNVETKMPELPITHIANAEGIQPHQFKDNIKQIRDKANTKQKDTGGDITTNTAAGSITMQIGYLEADLKQVNLQIGSEKDPKKIAELKAKSYRLQMQIRIKYQDLEIANKKFAEQMKKLTSK
ncbi:MAG: relaxase/mobilization nuclease domain-containing protein [Methylotenera sp.]|uniref:relaxase/mobilization nuclease domain-containing protein n=1 Tax=Methylotenera sp. TaxID=2051956 RepID=UPI00272F9E9B|nr:relaxase/mobilization nuclease domain-containing protein [Methylotenera sp.]MDP1521659.1 relaxase/mobilization nuclease domain-containing protein [Methylotenera sp.]